MESKELIQYEEKPIAPAPEKEPERIGFYQPQKMKKREEWTKVFLKYWRFAAITAAFAALFLLTAFPYIAAERPASGEDTTASPETTAEDVAVSAPMPKDPPLFIDEAKSGIDLAEFSDEGYSLAHLSDAKIVIIHSHTSESVSKSQSVSDAGEVISELLVSAGIPVTHIDEEFDSKSSMGAYERMRESALKLIKEDPTVALVIDLHDSDSGMPLTLTVGSSDKFMWRENLRLACAVYAELEGVNGAVRLLPRPLGQDTGVLTLNIGIGSSVTDEETARGLIAAVSSALIEIFNRKDPTETVGSFKLRYEYDLAACVSRFLANETDYAVVRRVSSGKAQKDLIRIAEDESLGVVFLDL